MHFLDAMDTNVQALPLFRLSNPKTKRIIEMRAAEFAAAISVDGDAVRSWVRSGGATKGRRAPKDTFPWHRYCTEQGKRAPARDFDLNSCCGFSAAGIGKDPIATIDDWALWLAAHIITTVKEAESGLPRVSEAKAWAALGLLVLGGTLGYGLGRQSPEPPATAHRSLLLPSGSKP